MGTTTDITGIPEEIVLRRFLLQVKAAGIQIELDGSDLVVTGPGAQSARGETMWTELVEEIRARKPQIVEAMTNLPEAVETHYVSRLKRGVEWLQECRKMLEKDPTNEKITMAYLDNTCRWGDVDEELRRIYPEYRGCPVGGCDTTGIPIRCMYCTESAAFKAWPEL